MSSINNIIVSKKKSILTNFKKNIGYFIDDLGTNYKGLGLAYGIISTMKPTIMYNIPMISIPMAALCIWPSSTLDFDRYSFGGFLVATATQKLFVVENLLNSNLNLVSLIKDHYFIAAGTILGGYYFYNLDYEFEMIGKNDNFHWSYYE